MSGFKSTAHKEKFKQLLKEGKIDQKTYDTMERGTKGILPARKHMKKTKAIKVIK